MIQLNEYLWNTAELKNQSVSELLSNYVDLFFRLNIEFKYSTESLRAAFFAVGEEIKRRTHTPKVKIIRSQLQWGPDYSIESAIPHQLELFNVLVDGVSIGVFPTVDVLKAVLPHISSVTFLE